MANPEPPVYDFDNLKPVTMTVIASYDVGELNLPAIFTFLPVTEQVLPPHLNIQKKQGKIRLPSELNRPGEILSMRYAKQVRGITRSDNARSFAHSIIIDIGTSDRIISAKLSRTLEFTGPRTIEIAREAATYLINHMKNCQSDLDFIRKNKERAMEIKERFLNLRREEANFDDEVGKRIWAIFSKQTRGYADDKAVEFLDFMINFNRNLYTGTLELGEFESEMANILFNLGYSINQATFAKVMNHAPFRCNFNNYKSTSAVVVNYDYVKTDRTGQPKQSKHTIRVNRSGHVRHSGPGLKAMKGVYYAFMQRVLLNFEEIQSVESGKQILKISGKSRAISIEEWRDLIRKEEDLRERIVQGLVPMAKGEFVINAPVVAEQEHRPEVPERVENPLLILNEAVPIQEYQNQPLPSLRFDYAPLIATR